MDAMPSDLLSPNQVAKKLGVHVGTVYRWMEKEVRGRRLKSFLMGGRRKITADDLDRFLREEQRKEFDNTGDRNKAAQNSLRMFGVRVKETD